MGAYMSSPVVEKESEEGNNEYLSFAACSMQGWRMNQEDAHNCILDFDVDNGLSLFAVYDGHGGSEVARYCAEHIPSFLRNLPAYSDKSNMSDTLKQLFLDFDASLIKPETRAILNSMLETEKDGTNDQNEGKVINQTHFVEADSANEDEDESDSEIFALRAEANQPIEHVLEKYGGENALPGDIKEILEIRRKNKVGECSTSVCQPKTTISPSESDTIEDSSKTDVISDDDTNNIENSIQGKDDSKPSPIISDSADKSLNVNNGDKFDDDEKEEANEKEEGDDDEDEDDDDEEEDDDDDDDEIMNMYEAKGVDYSDDDDDDDSDSDSDEEEDESIEPFNFSKALKTDEDCEPGVDSGSTACLALLIPMNGIVRLYVSNAGDSRAVLCRGGAAVDLSVDHKPEDKDEQKRIVTAGGIVTRDGRVNGGLNLSRALGDHSYKQVPNIPLTEQMITPSPDVMEFDLIPGADEFLVIACDGVWNSMTSQQVIEFVYDRLHAAKDGESDVLNSPCKPNDNGKLRSAKLIKICHELFDYCLAPNTNGDGTGCDNMTCIIVHFDNLKKLAQTFVPLISSSSNITHSSKRGLSTPVVALNGQSNGNGECSASSPKKSKVGNVK